MKIQHYVMAAASLAVIACNHEDKWSVSGNITGGEGKLLTLERSYSGMWGIVDSVRLDQKGNFKFESAPAGYPDIYRVSIDDQSAYFPIDSLDNITIEADAATMASNYRLSGSTSAEILQGINKLVNDKVAAMGRKAAGDSLLKRELSGMVLGDMSGIVSYYIINKEIGGQRIFDPSDKGDLRVIGAVTNAFKSQRPNDPRTRIMEAQYIGWRRALNASTTSIEATEIGYPEIVLKDINNVERRLSSLVGKGKPVIVNFTAYAAENSPAINVVLANIYNAGNADIYQVSVDNDEYLWREAARNLPWTAVLQSPRDGNSAMRSYNVQGLPMTYVIDRNGMLQERVDDITKLSDIVAKYK
ncbi:MAG: AhpC/TSA family protein [Clostridiales bacterium]|nr:AhpC/TSA family protein [Clostridiales bacterium]